MDFLRQQFTIVQDRLAGLSASQKMLTAALAVIVVMTMLYWGRFASNAEMVALPTPVAAEEADGVMAALRSKGIAAKLEGGKVMVPAEQQFDAMGDLSFQGLVSGAGTSNAIDAMLDKATPWQTQGELTARMNSAKQHYLAAILRKWPGVASADVVITDTPTGTITRRDPHLAVFMTTKKSAGVDRRKLASSARSFMSNCMSGLKHENIGISVDGATINGGDSADPSMLSGDLLATIREAEGGYVAKLQNAFSGIPGVLVSVSVELDNARRTIKSRDIDPTTKIVETQTLETASHTPVGPGSAAQEPGIVANTSLDATSIAAAPSGPTGTQVETRKETNLIDFNHKDMETVDPGGKCAAVGATVSVPRSYFVAVWRQRQGKAAANAPEPSEPELQPLIDSLLVRIKKTTHAVTGIKDDARISVTDFQDLEPIIGGPMLAAATPGNELTSMATRNAREIALGVLAVASLFMVSRMVKKSEPAPLAMAGVGGAGGATGLLARAGDAEGDAGEATGTGGRRRPTTIGGEDIAGEVGGDAGSVMTGHELDPDVLETSQIIEQVSNFVKTNPDAAASMLGRWMSRD